MSLSKSETVAVAAVLLFALFFSLRGLTTYPTFWFDEALNIQQARNLAEQGYLNLQTAPGVPYAKPYHLTTGYPVIAPLALVFKVFGFDFAYACLYMIGWLLLFLFSAYFLAKELFGWKTALFSLLLLATFAPVYGNGETVIAEVPALALFFLGVFVLRRSHHRPILLFLSGLLLGLCASVKPLYFLLAPALAISGISGKKEHSWRTELLLWLGFRIPLVLYIWTILPPLGVSGSADTIVSFWESRTAQGHFFQNIAANIQRFFTDISLLYTLLISVLIAVSVSWKKIWQSERDRALLLLSTYGVLIFLFFLQSIGWNRYLLFYQAIILLLLPGVLSMGVQRFSQSRFALRSLAPYYQLGLVLLVFLQTVRLFFFSHIFYGTSADDFSQFVKEKAPSGSIYVVSSAEAAAFVPSSRLSQHFDFFEKDPPMNNLLAHLTENHFEHLLVSTKDEKNVAPYLSGIRARYKEVGTVRGLTLFTLK